MTHQEYIRAQKLRLQRAMLDLSTSVVSRPMERDMYLVSVGRYQAMKLELEGLDKLLEEPEDEIDPAPEDLPVSARKRSHKARSWGG